MGKIFVRERTQTGKGAGRPRFAIVAVSELDLKVYHSHIRREELEKLAQELGAEVIHLPRGDRKQEDGQGQRHRRRREQAGNQE
jgi:hypothetical protein